LVALGVRTSEAAAAGFVELGLRTSEAAALGFTASGCDNAGWFELNVRKTPKANLRHWKLRIWWLSSDHLVGTARRWRLSTT
jgi:hypothetical protein